jgi:ParB/RepB/Spo0J family partition protein
VIPTGTLMKLSPDEIKPNPNNPRLLFDPAQLQQLKKNIREHGVLVPITVYQPRGQTKYSILDGERRYRCVRELNKEGHKLELPANVVETPTKIAGLLYMFSIHNFREAWELMPTALSLKIVMGELGVDDNKALAKFTGLSEAQIERCKKLLKFPERFQELSLDPEPTTRIPSNFWIEALPVLDLAEQEIPTLKALGRDKITDILVEKYQAKKIKSVIHFRRIMESYELNEDEPATRAAVIRRVEQFFLKRDLETRAAFDQFIVGKRRFENALATCDGFLRQLRQLKLANTADDDERRRLREALIEVQLYCESLAEALRGSDDPEISKD